MKVNNIKGALLEYIVRNLLKSCGFTNAKADGLYTFERSGLLFVNGRGAAHDADVMMDPPVQMPFAYPTRIIFECKAYGGDANLSVVRNAFGLRNDINEFEIVTKDSLKRRQNNRRASYAVETRKRYHYQVGVACVNDFSRPAVEFAANSKIPLLSLSWFVGRRTIQSYNKLSQAEVDRIDTPMLDNLYKYFKDRDGNLHSTTYDFARRLLEGDSAIGDIVTSSNTFINLVYVALIETGDLIFLHPRQEDAFNILSHITRFANLVAEIHYVRNKPNIWLLTVLDAENNNRRTEFEFFIPERIFDHWKQFNLDKTVALDMKEQFFSRIFIFGKDRNREYPFLTVRIDQEWLDRARNQ